MNTIQQTEDSAITQSQIKWAKEHDWFRGVTCGGAVVVDVTTYGPNGDIHPATALATSFKVLRELAGY